MDNARKSAHALPLRTCIATRTTAPRTALLRLVSDPHNRNRVLADPQATAPGRGAWITPEISAFELAVQRKAIQRALRLQGPLDTSHVYDYLAAHSSSSGKSSGVIGAQGRQDRN